MSRHRQATSVGPKSANSGRQPRSMRSRSRPTSRSIVVPELTLCFNIKLNERVLLRPALNQLSISHRAISQARAYTKLSRRRSYSGDGSVGVRSMRLFAERPRFQLLGLSPKPAWAEVWHLWRVILPKRSITGRLVRGQVWRRHDGRRWIYKKFSEYKS